MRSPRAAARREVTKRLAEMKRRIIVLQGSWTPGTTVYVDKEARKPGENVYLRERQLDEYPEAQRAYWGGTISELDIMAEQIAALRAHCVREYHITPKQPAEAEQS
jgi:hypothetical protein